MKNGKNTTLNETKNRIYNSAKILFYKNGYLGTDLKDIAEMADVPIPLITYYFKKKILIAANIYTDFIESAGRKINEYCSKNHIESALLKEMLLSYIIYDIVLFDERNKRFYMQLKSKNLSFYALDKSAIETYFYNYIEEYGLTVSKQHADIYIKMNSEARRGFFDYYNENHLNMEVIEIVNSLCSMIPSIIGISREEIDSKLFLTQSVIKEIDYSDLCFLAKETDSVNG